MTLPGWPWPPTKEFLQGLYFSGWRKTDIAWYFHKDIEEVDKLLKSYKIGPRPPKPVGQGRIPKSNHSGDGYKKYCSECGYNHWLCPPKPEGCNFGYVKKANKFNEHLLNLRDGHKCYSCGYVPKEHCKDFWTRAERHLEMQHILPLSRGGTNCAHNLIWLCAGPRGCHTKLAVGRKYGGIPQAIPHTCDMCRHIPSETFI